MKKRNWGYNTLTIHTGKDRAFPKGAHNMPVFLTGTFVFKDLEEAEKKFKGGSEEGYNYTRIDHPNFRQLEAKIAALEKGEEALVFSSGMSAINTVIQYLAQGGGQVICTQTLYGHTDKLFTGILPSLGIKFSFVDTRDSKNVREAIIKAAKNGAKRIVIFLETPSNPTLDLADIRAISEIADEYRNSRRKIYLVVDNSFATPYNQRPLELGADFVIQSVTKYLNGHGDLIMGAVIGKSPLMREGKESLFHWRIMTGPTPSPFDCYLAERGLKTFALRMERHNYNAWHLAEFLESKGLRVIYPGLKSHPQYELAKRQMLTPYGEPGFSGMISFELKGGFEAVKKFFNSLPKKETHNDGFISLAVSLGYIETLIQSPALMTHIFVPRKKRLKTGISDGLIRVSVGLEDYQDLEEAFDRALRILGN